MDQMRDGDARQAYGFAGAVGADQDVELRRQLAGLRGVEGARVGVPLDVGFDGVGQLQGYSDTARVETFEVQGEQVGVFGGGGLMAFFIEGFAGGDFRAPFGTEVVLGCVEDCNEDFHHTLGFCWWGARVLGELIVVVGVVVIRCTSDQGERRAGEERTR